MEYILLGLLMLKSRTIYEFRQCIGAGLNLMYSCSTGSIQAGIRKLLAGGCILCREIEDHNRKKKLYEITEDGRAYFSAWVNDPMKAMSEKHPELAKLYFMGFSDREQRQKNIRALIAEMEQAYGTICVICAQGETMEVPPEARDILHYQLASARFGRDLMKFQLDWYREFLKEEEGRT